MRQLRRLNFEDLISVGMPNVSEYTFEQYRRNGYEHTRIKGYCISCEEMGYNLATDDHTYRLTNISHGAHSSDFFMALKGGVETSDWHNTPVVFVYETPSLDYGIYKEISYSGHFKHPSKDWYWIHNDQEPVLYPNRFSGGEYGGFVLSVILTFKLSNVYITNLVKCGLNNAEGKFKGLGSYSEETIKNCLSRFLDKELFILKPKVVFAVGSAVEYWINRVIKGLYYVQQLPHPAGRRRGFRDEHYKAIYFWGVARALHKVGIIDLNEGCELAKMYLDKYDEGKA